MSTQKLSDKLAVILCDRSKRAPAKGICGQELVGRDDLSRALVAWTDTHPCRSWAYPVTGGRAAYLEAVRLRSMWRGAYGNERKELLRFMIRYYRERGQ